MNTLEQEFNDFAAFVKQQLTKSAGLTIDDVFDEWREAHPSDDDALAIKASLNDMAAGETGRPFEEFVADFRERNGITEN